MLDQYIGPIEDQYLGLIGLVSMILGFLVTVVSFVRYRRGAQNLREREERLPDATLFDDLRRKVVDHQNKLDGLQEDLLNAREEIGRGQAVKAEHQHLSQQIERLRSDLTEVEVETSKRKNNAESEYGRLIGELQTKLLTAENNFELEKGKLETRLLECKREIQSQIVNLQDDLDRKKKLASHEIEDRRFELENQLKELKNEVSKQESIVKAERELHLRKTQQAFEESLFNLQQKNKERIQQLESETAALEISTTKLRESNQELRDNLMELSEKLNDLSNQKMELDRDVASLRTEKIQLESSIPKLQQLWDRLLQQTGGGDDAERTAELWQPVLQDSSTTSKRVSEEDCLDRIENHMIECGLRFSQRLILAFHTALKVTDASPLVVLAGISGTGKSELPRRYAEAVGMNFLPIAVQPRWDSPQDMFGFFNYLENRFRATELGRVLVQMDRFSGEPGRGWPTPMPKEFTDLSDQMLLVLLDEMNLARVEYYFSDFLSKLETRRGVDVNDGEKRRKAELAFEIGRTGIGSPVMNVFVGTNVLFVGTMNEDESTQTLSDKVIDRSNLIRFGSPKKLDIERRGIPVAKTDGRFSYKNWESWQVNSSQVTKDSEQLDEYIDRLNEVMSIVRRPFAHRTSQSIRAYVANYPKLYANSFNHALADQIEQKLLPKYRGLDPSEPDVRESLDKLRDIIGELEDAELEAALNASRNGHQFSWSGVDRLIVESTK